MIDEAEHREIQMPRDPNVHIIAALKVQSPFLLSKYVTNHRINPPAPTKHLPQQPRFTFAVHREKRPFAVRLPKPRGAEGGEQRGRVQKERAEEQEEEEKRRYIVSN